MTRISIVGADGQLGFDLSRVLREREHDVVEWTHADIEITDPSSIEHAFSAASPDVVINTAAVNVEASEVDPAKAYAVNTTGAGNLARAATARDIKFIHLSTDYVFDGTKGSPYVERDAVKPINVYGKSKFAGEALVISEAQTAVVIRSSGLYGERGVKAKGGMNFVTTMLKLAEDRDELSVVADEALSPTNTFELAQQIAVLIAKPELVGVFHATANGGCSWFEFASEIFRIAGVDIDLRETTSAEFSANAAVPITRPRDTRLENFRLGLEGLDQLRSWQEQLDAYLTAIGRAA
jgi:dTDP-4-dehydrorhamnose reductase